MSNKSVPQLKKFSRAEQRGSEGVVLTFDDGPSPASTPVLLDLLARYRLLATFFVCRRAVRYFRSRLCLMQRPFLQRQVTAGGNLLSRRLGYVKAGLGPMIRTLLWLRESGSVLAWKSRLFSS
ncbi:MAG: hypothetical protein D3909_01650 [Candidatus Electrothrix sp. ATG1]|nr:hypothetical protein [Candidatus Electrothrix sp. ATG1]